MSGHMTTIAVTLLLSGAAASAQARDLDFDMALHQEAARLTARVETVSREIQFHADWLTTRGQNVSLSRESHAEHLATAHLLVDRDLRPALEQLEALQAALPEWKQKSVESMREAADYFAARIAAAHSTKVAEPGLPPGMNAAYRTHVTAAARHLETLIVLSDATSSYLQGRIKAASLELFPLVG